MRQRSRTRAAACTRTRGIAAAVTPSRPPPPELCRELLEDASALFVIVEHVVAGAGRREEHGVARSRDLARSREHFLEVGTEQLDGNDPCQILHDDRSRFPVGEHLLGRPPKLIRERAVRLTLVPAAEQQHGGTLHAA